MSYGSWREIELAREYRDRLLNGTQSFSAGVEEQLSKIASRATVFDIETGGLHPSSPIYEMGFMHGIGPKSTFTHEFVKPTIIGGKRTGEISPFTRDLITNREAALQASGDLSGPFMDVLHNASTTQKQAGYKALSQLGNRDVWVQNLQHERSFINERIGAQHFENWGVRNRLQSFTRGSPTPGGGLYTTPLELKQALGKASRATALGTLDTHLNAWEEVFTKGFAPELERSFNGTRVFDIMDLSKSVFAMAQNRGYMPKTGEIFTGTSVNTYANLMYGENELHTALADNVLQGQMVRDLAGAGYAMQKGESLPEHMQRFFGDLGKNLPEIKRRNTVKNIIDTYTNQQKFLLSKAQGKPDYELLKGARVRHSNRTLSLPVEVLDDNTGTYSRRKLQFFLRTKADPRMNPHEFSTDIEKVVRARAAREARSGIGVKVDYDAALAEARTSYINAFEESVKTKVAGGATRAEALEHAISTHAPKMESLAQQLSPQLVPSGTAPKAAEASMGSKFKNFLRENWKIGLVGAGALFAAHLISSNDDDYNYIEGMKHAGIAGASRRYNTDFGSGWQGLSSQDIQGLRPFFEDISQEGLEQFARLTSMDQGDDNGIRRSRHRGSFRIPTNIYGNSIMGMQEESPLTGRKGIGARMRRHYGFGSPWQGMRIFAEDIVQEGLEQYSRHIARSHTLKDPFEGLNMGFQGNDIQDSSITDYSVEDADTVNVTLAGGREMTVRLAGIDAPEIQHDNQQGRIWPNQPYGQEAKAKLEQILARQEQLRLAYNPDGSSSYGRTAGVLLGDNNANINLQLVEAGAAASLPFGKRKDQIVNATDFNRAEQEALAAQRGMWNEEAWQISREMQMNSKRRITNTSYTDLGRLFRDFKTAAILNRMRNPDAEFSDMEAAGGKDDFNTIEGMKHGWIGASREANIKDFGSGYVIDKSSIPRTPTSMSAKSALMSGHRAAVSQMRRNMNRYNVIGHHRG